MISLYVRSATTTRTSCSQAKLFACNVPESCCSSSRPTRLTSSSGSSKVFMVNPQNDCQHTATVKYKQVAAEHLLRRQATFSQLVSVFCQRLQAGLYGPHLCWSGVNINRAYYRDVLLDIHLFHLLGHSVSNHPKFFKLETRPSQNFPKNLPYVLEHVFSMHEKFQPSSLHTCWNNKLLVGVVSTGFCGG